MSRTAPLVMVDAYPGLHAVGGIVRYVHDLGHALATRPDAPPARMACPSDMRAEAETRFPPGLRRILPLPWKLLAPLIAGSTRLGLPLDALYGRPAVFHSTMGAGPLFSSARLITHVHDLTWLDHPEWHPIRTRLFFAATVPAAVRSAAVVLTHSNHVARLVHETYGVPLERFVTIPPPLGYDFRPIEPAAAAARVRNRFGFEGAHVLHVGTFEPRKNHVRLIGAFERMCRAGFPGKLVLVGRDGWHVGPILERLERSPERSRILRLVGLDDADLVALYGACTVCAFPSLEEGFGMPLLESMACGAPCVTSDHPALVELGAGYAAAVPAHDEVALAGALLEAWRDPAAAVRARTTGPTRAAAFAFDRWTSRIFELYRRELAMAGVTPRVNALTANGNVV